MMTQEPLPPLGGSATWDLIESLQQSREMGIHRPISQGKKKLGLRETKQLSCWSCELRQAQVCLFVCLSVKPTPKIA